MTIGSNAPVLPVDNVVPISIHQESPPPTSEPVSLTPEVTEKTAPAVNSLPEKLQATDDLNWSQLSYELDLEAIARQIVINSVVAEYKDNNLKLIFLPNLEVMLKPEVEQQIRQAIEKKLGNSVQITFESQSVLNCETPYEAKLRLEEEQRQVAIAEIRQDPVVQELNQAFGAELIEESVKLKE